MTVSGSTTSPVANASPWSASSPKAQASSPTYGSASPGEPPGHLHGYTTATAKALEQHGVVARAYPPHEMRVALSTRDGADFFPYPDRGSATRPPCSVRVLAAIVDGFVTDRVRYCRGMQDRDSASAGGPLAGEWVDSLGAAFPVSGRANAVAALLRSRIQSGELNRGDRLPPERELARQLGVSRLTLRGALEELRDQGYLTARRGQSGGNFVSELTEPVARWMGSLAADFEEIEDILEYRIALECRAAALAAVRAGAAELAAVEDAMVRFECSSGRAEFRRADADFHNLLAVASGSRRLAELVPVVRGELFSPVDHLTFDPPKDDAVVEHRAVFDAVVARDAEGASRAVLVHLEHTRRELRNLT